MLRVFVQLVCIGDLDDLAEIHDCDALGNVPHDEKVMRDEQIRHAELFLQLFKHVDDLRLNGHVQRGDRLVADDELRVHGKRSCNADSLALTAGKFMRVARGMLSVESDGCHEVQDFFAALFPVGVELMHIQRLPDNIFDRHARVQRRIRVLEDHLHLLAHVGDVLCRDRLAVEDDLACRRLIEPQNRASDGRLAAAGLADQTQRLAAPDGKRHIVDSFQGLRAQKTRADREILLEVFDLH